MLKPQSLVTWILLAALVSWALRSALLKSSPVPQSIAQLETPENSSDHLNTQTPPSPPIKPIELAPKPEPEPAPPITQERSFHNHPDFELQDSAGPSIQEFIDARPDDLREVLATAKPFRGFRTAWTGVLGGYDFAGDFDLQGTVVKFRYSIGTVGPRTMVLPGKSCFALQYPSQEEIFGSVEDQSLRLLEAPHRTAHIFVLADRHFFYVFNCAGTAKGCERDRWPSIVMLYYLKQDDGKIIYQGQARWATFASPIYSEPSQCALRFDSAN